MPSDREAFQSLKAVEKQIVFGWRFPLECAVIISKAVITSVSNI